MGTATVDGSLAWQWILEHLIDSKEVGTPILREMMTYIPNLAYLSSLHRRTALRYLEEAIAASRINAQTIPLLMALFKESHSATSFPTGSDYRTLMLRVQVEAVIVHVRGHTKDWHGYSKVLDQLFPDNVMDPDVLKTRSELLTLLQDQNHERRLKEVLEKYALITLKQDLLKCVNAEKGRLGKTFLEKLLQDVFNGTYPVSMASHKPISEKEESEEDFLSADGQKGSVGSDDQTIIAGRNSNAGLEETIESKETKKLRLELPTLRQRDQHGKAITSASPAKPTPVKGLQDPVSRLADDKKISLGTAGDSLHVEFLTLGKDGHEEFCHQCQEGGRLICCDGCPIAVHKKCLGQDVKSYKEEDWFCPLCVQKRAMEILVKAKAEESAARKRVLQFMEGMNGRNVQKQHQSSSKVLEKEARRKSSDSGNCAYLQQDNARNIPVTRRSSLSKETSKQVSASRKQSVAVDPSEACNDVFSKCESPAHPSPKQVSSPIEQDCKNEKTMEVPKMQALGGDIEKATRQSEELRTSEKHATVASLSNMEVKQTDSSTEKLNPQGQIGEGDGHDGDLEEDNESRKPESPKTKDPRLYNRGNRIIPGLRRKRLQWSKEEEDALRDGVKRFSHDNGSWGFQWTRILEFGQGKFHPSRTDIDLKDKWRNLCKH